MELSGPQAFYNQPHYEEVTKSELRDISPPKTPVVVFDRSPRWVRLSKEMVFNGSSLALIYIITNYCFKKITNRVTLPEFPKPVVWMTVPIGIYNSLYILAGWGIHNGSLPFSKNLDSLSHSREEIFDKAEVVKRFNIEANGYTVDTLVLGQKESFDKGRCLIVSLGTGENLEHAYFNYVKLAEKLDANLVLYNYPCYGASGGFLPNKEAVLASHQAMHVFARKNLKAKEIIDIGFSIGGGVQGESLKDLDFDEKVKYVFVKNMTFANLSGVVDDIVISHSGKFVSLLNWEYSCVSSSKALKHPELIIQAGQPKHCRKTQRSIIFYDLEALRKEDFEVLSSPDQLIENDGIVSASNSCAKVLLDDPTCPKDKKVFLAGKYLHSSYFNSEKLAEVIEKQLQA